MLRLKIVFRIAVALLATIAFGIIAVLIAARVPAVQKFLATEAAQMVGPEVHFDRIDVAFWPGLGLALIGVCITEDDSADAKEVFSAERIGLILDIPSLFAGVVELDTIAFSGANLTLERAPDGTSSLSNLLGRFATAAEEEQKEQEPSQVGRIPEIEGRGSSLLFVDLLADGSRREVAFSDISIDLEESRPGEVAEFEAEVTMGEGRVSLTGKIHRKPDGLGVLDGPLEAELKGSGLPADAILYFLLPGDSPQNVRGKLDVTARIDGIVLETFQGSGHLEMGSGGSFDWLGIEFKAPLVFDLDFEVGDSDFAMPSGTLRASTVAWRKLQASDLSIQMHYAAGGLRFSDAKLTFYGGNLDYAGTLRFGDDVAYQGKVGVEGVSMPLLMTDLFDSSSEIGFETLQTSFDFKGSYSEGEDALESAEGSGSMRLEGGKIPSGTVIGAVGLGLLSIVPSILKPSGSGKSIDPTKIEYLSQEFELKKQVLHVSNLAFVTRDYTLAGNGSIGLNGSVNLSTELDFTIVGMQKLLITTAVPLPKTGVDILPAIPMYVTGTITSPVFLPELQKLPFMALQIFFAPVRGAAKALFGGIRGAGSHLTSWMRPSS